MDMSYTIEVMAFLWHFAYFGQNLVVTETSLRPLQSEKSSLDWSTSKPTVISNHILVISCRNAFIATLVPKLVAMVTPLCPLCTGVSQTNSVMLSQNQTLHGYVAYNWSYGHFCDSFAYFGQNLVAMSTSLRTLQSEMSCLDCSTLKTPCCK